MELQGGTLLQGGRYRIIHTLGRGGFGITYLAEDKRFNRVVCIKEFFPKNYYKRANNSSNLIISSEGFADTMDKCKEKFIKEAQIIATLNHLNITRIFDLFEENSSAYYVMEYIKGESLSSVVQRCGALSEREAIGYITQIASALKYIHNRNIMHLDVKPGNIMLRNSDGCAILIDFGLSKHYDDNGDATSTMSVVGASHGFAPMEQYKKGGVGHFSPETDIYSLGATLYYLVTGNTPPEAAALLSEPLNIPASISPNVKNAILVSMAIAPQQRPQSIDEFMEILGAVNEVDYRSEGTELINTEEGTMPLPDNSHTTSKVSGAVHKTTLAVKKHFNELTRHGILVGINAKEKIVTEIALDGKCLFTIESNVDKVGIIKLHLDTPETVECYTNLVGRNAINDKIHNGLAIGNQHQSLVDIITTILNELDPNMGANRVETKTSISARSSVYKPLLISFVFTFTLCIVVSFEREEFSPQTCMLFPILCILFSPMTTKLGHKYSKMERLVKIGSILIMTYSALIADKDVYDNTPDLEVIGLFFMLYFLILICYTYIRVFKIGAKSRSLRNMIELAPAVAGLLLTLTLFIDESMFISFWDDEHGLWRASHGDVLSFSAFLALFAVLQPIYSALLSPRRRSLD